MQSYFSARVWEKSSQIPFTCKAAAPFDYEIVKDSEVVTISNARYRNATVDGTFVLSPFFILPTQTSGIVKIDVLCRWFDHRLKSTGLTLKVDLANAVFVSNFSGTVVSNIEK